MSRHGGPVRRDAGWWKRHGRRTTLDPHRIGLRSGPIHRRHVERYVRNPRARADGGTPVCVVKLAGGRYFAREGAHRITAAREAGRRVEVLLVDERVEQNGK